MSVKLEDIAKELGISMMTVSRALNNTGYVKKETRTKVLKAAKEMEYVPNVLARGLVIKKTFNIGLIITNISNPFYARITRVIQEEALRNGYRLILFNTNENINLEKEALYSLREQRCDGVLLTSTESDYSHIIDLKKKGLPIVLINRRPKKINVDFVVCDNKKGGYLATSYLLSMGHKKIAHITGPTYITSVKEKIDGYKMAYKDYNIRINPKLIFETELTVDGAYKATLEMIEDHPDITAVFAYTDWMTIGVIKALQEKNVKIPGEISIVGYDNIDVSPYLKVPLTTIDLPIGLMGKKSVEILLKKINGVEESSKIIGKIYQPKLIKRKSVIKR